ncbi:putative WD repeat-containing protein 36 [Apostichopus japonicus]|uniref:Putative WD repeat-containing protein 36 n=1 Tax=Stichopus japonicus TaxID=307972 RepID=A0A2G8LP09_STIJA|nr:putative WD repeat-containing protein 36 [Apostichopus japonicus]
MISSWLASCVMGSKLELLSVSDTHPEDITCLATDAGQAYTAYGNIIKAYARGQQAVHIYKGHEKNIHLLLSFGEHLISVDEASNLKIWDKETEETYLDVEFDNSAFQISCVLHPTTYLNKILLGSRQGSLQLWNIKRNALIHTFEGWGSPIRVLEQAPAVDVIAVGLENGKIFVHNIKYDETLVSFQLDWGPVTSIAFRTDGEPMMATGSTVGHIAIWNLEERKLQAQMRDAHAGSVTGMAFFRGEPILITNSPDNQLKVWVFDQSDGSGRLLRRRCGHSAPPSRILFYGNDGRNIISAGQDSSLKSFSTFHESLNRDFGQAYANKKSGKRLKNKLERHKLGTITALACESSKKSDWDSIVACHQGSSLVTTWDYTRCTMGKYKICPPELEDDLAAQATAVDVTSCGNFVVIGWNTGHVKLYNIQSGIYRGNYGKDKGTAHSGPVRGVAVDGLNQVAMTTSSDQKVKFWHFREKKLLQEVDVQCPVSQMKLHRESSMVALAMDNFSIYIIDIELRRIVRKYQGHQNVVSDMAFSSDARWLVSASMDCSVRTWDLPTSKMVDCFLVDAAVTSLCISPTNAYLATTHVDDLGIYLWSNRTLYSHVSLRPLPSDYEPTVILMPGACLDTKDEGPSPNLENDLATLEFQSPEQISAELITLSLLPNSRWQSLTNLDLIKTRNKPKEPLKVPKSAPFFLPVVSGLEPSLDVQKETKSSKVRKVAVAGSLNLASELCQLLLESAQKEDRTYEAVLEYMTKLNPSATDTEIRSLDPIGGGSHIAMAIFMKALIDWLQSNQSFEIVQAYISLFLKIHGDEISRTSELVELLESLLGEQEKSWQRLQGQFNQTMCLINYMKSAVLS